VLSKLNKARLEFHSSEIKKTGHNKFAGYYYFELADFLIPALEIFNRLNLCAVISFTSELATMTITDIDDGSSIEITSPMSTAALKACHEVQNLGAVQTYLRRYLWVTALEIVEHDALDSSDGAAPKDLEDIASKLIDEALGGDEKKASATFYGLSDADKKAVWPMLCAESQAAIRKHKAK